MKTKLTLFVTVLTFALLGAGCSSLNKGLVAYYPFNGNANDESGNGNDGTLHPGQFGGLKKQVKDRHGKLGQAYFFDGHSTITVENHPSLNFSDAMTISVWVNQGDNSRLGPGVICNGDRSNNGAGFSYGLNASSFSADSGDGRPRFLLSNTERSKEWFVNLSSWEIKNSREWNHVVATYNGKSAQVYLNGKLEANAPAKNQKIQAYKRPIIIGMVDHLAFGGEMDDLRLYNRGLSAEEVKALYDLEKPKGK
jgi:hypothetical protein